MFLQKLMICVAISCSATPIALQTANLSHQGIKASTPATKIKKAMGIVDPFNRQHFFDSDSDKYGNYYAFYMDGAFIPKVNTDRAYGAVLTIAPTYVHYLIDAYHQAQKKRINPLAGMFSYFTNVIDYKSTIPATGKWPLLPAFSADVGTYIRYLINMSIADGPKKIYSFVNTAYKKKDGINFYCYLDLDTLTPPFMFMSKTLMVDENTGASLATKWYSN